MNGVVELNVFRPGDASPGSSVRIIVKPSQLYYLGYYVKVLIRCIVVVAIYRWLAARWNVPLSVLFVPLTLQALKAGWRALELACISYGVEADRVIWRRGVFSRETGSMEFFRVQNVGMTQTFFQRVGGVGDVALVTQDRTNQFLGLLGMKQPELLRDRINEYVMQQRRLRGFQEVVVN